MKSCSNLPKKLHVETNDSDLHVATQSIETCSRELARAIAILKPELAAIRTDASSFFGDVQCVIDEFMAKPANRGTQLFAACSTYNAQLRRLAGLIDPLVILGTARSDALAAAASDLAAACHRDMADKLGPYFPAETIRRHVEFSLPMLRVRKFIEAFGNLSFGMDIERVANRYSLEPCENAAADVLNLLVHQQRKWAEAQHHYEELVKYLGAL